MHLWNCNQRLTPLLDGLHTYLALVSTSLSHKKFAPAFWCGWHLPMSVFLFYKVFSTTPWPFGKTSRDLLSYWGFHFNCLLPTFSGVAPKFLDNLIVLSALYILGVLSQFSRNYCILLPGIPYPSTKLSLRRSHGILVPFTPVKKGSKVLRGTASRLRDMPW